MLPDKKYAVIYADPPWAYGDKGFGKRPTDGSVKGSFAPEAGRYGTMLLEDIVALPVATIAAKDSALLLWATSPLLPEAMQVMSAWGFKFKTVAFCWSKITSTGKEVANLGQWTMGNVEICLLGTKGSPKRLDRTVRQLVTSARTEHSKKPEEVADRIVRIFGDVPRIELFARRALPGWDCWGNEAPSDILYDL
jgi:N6-adenosine-specific RNA methylase IME4